MGADFSFLPPPPGGGGGGGGGAGPPARAISIHAPREGSDPGAGARHGADRRISIHAPREGSDDINTYKYYNKDIFLSTLPVRGATMSPFQPWSL